jgi:N-acetyl sugar amidotransferase
MSQYRICTRCVMDTSAKNITFDEAGHCNFCIGYLERHGSALTEAPEERDQRLANLVEQVKLNGRGKRYDCIVGVSGGVDSAYTLMKVVDLGLRPLAVHMDNGWNSELAQNNIANLVKTLNVDLHTHVIEWQEYRALMLAFMDADVIDVELLYDNAMLKVNYQQAAKYRLNYILSGSNQASEGILMPEGWNWYKRDKRNIKAIAATGGASLRTFPSMSTIQYLYYRYIRRISWASFLDSVDYRKEGALTELENRFGFKRYPYKHYESILTRYYQGFLLPTKFGIDKRRLHLSNLIVSNQLSREDALLSLGHSPYPDPSDLRRDTKYFLKKARWQREHLDAYVSRPERSHAAFKSERILWDTLIRINNLLERAPNGRSDFSDS